MGETVGLEHRLRTPRAFGRDVGWDHALQLVADRFREMIAAHEPDSVAFYVSGQLLTEDSHVANKLMKGFIGSANIDTNSRLCMASTVAGHKRALGTDTAPGPCEDLDQADLVMLVGSNLTLNPGSDVALFNRLLTRIHQGGHVQPDFLTRTEGFADALHAARRDDPAPTGLTEAEIDAFCDLWIKTRRVVTVFSQGVNQSSCGTDKVNAILNCQPATGPFSVTGQPNAMGGREVRGLASTLACHLDIEYPDHRAAVRQFWQVPKMPERAGLKAVDMFCAVEAGRIKALWIIHTNPAATKPDVDRVRRAIARCLFVVVSDVTRQTDTARLARVLLPATG